MAKRNKRRPINQRKDRRELVAQVLAADATGGNMVFSGVAEIGLQAAAADGQAPRRPTVRVAAYNGGTMRIPGYVRPVVVDIAGISNLGRTIPLLRDHDRGRVVGHGVGSADAAGGLVVAGSLSAENDDSADIAAAAKNEFPWQASIGLQPDRLEQVAAGNVATANGRRFTGPVTIVRAGKLFEVSIVAIGADDTTATQVAAQGAESMNFEQWLKAKGWDPSTLNAAQLDSLRAAYEASGFATGSGTGNAGGDSGGNGQGGNSGGGAGAGAGTRVTASASTQAILAAARAREERSRAYGQIIAGAINRGMPAEEAELLVAAAEDAQVSETQFELDVMRAERESVAMVGYGNARRRGPQDTPQDVLECALAMTAGETEFDMLNADGTRTRKQLYSSELMQRAEDAYPRGLTLMELVVKAARRNGFITDSYRVSKAMLQAAFAPIMARGASTYDLSGVLSNVANKSIVAGFDSVETSWREVSAIGTVTDFKEITHYALTGDFVYEQVGKGGELKHATMGEQSYANKADTYGKIFAITRQDFINDDLSAFNRVRTLLGRGAALKLNMVFWTEFLADVTTFFASGRGNYMEGSTTPLDIDSLTAAELLFLNQTDPDGNPLGIDAAILLVPNALATLATRLTRDTEIRVDGSSSKTTYTTSNPHAGKWRPVRSSYLNNAAIPNGSATHWFLTANPMDLPLIETVFLNGQQRPIVEGAEADFDQLGVQMRGYHDFGSRKQEYRAGVRSKGAAA